MSMNVLRLLALMGPLVLMDSTRSLVAVCRVLPVCRVKPISTNVHLPLVNKAVPALMQSTSLSVYVQLALPVSRVKPISTNVHLRLVKTALLV
jgi:hypothetical protein